jgi:hypothetical protein
MLLKMDGDESCQLGLVPHGNFLVGRVVHDRTVHATRFFSFWKLYFSLGVSK